MQYRIHPKTGDKISVIGIGTGPIFEAPEKEAVTALTYAYEQGINYADFATAGAKTFFLRRKSVLVRYAARCSIRSISGPTTKPVNTAGPPISTRLSAKWTGS